MAFKLVELNNMAAYLDTDAEMIGNLTIAQIRVRFFYIFLDHLFLRRSSAVSFMMWGSAPWIRGSDPTDQGEIFKFVLKSLSKFI